MNCIIQRSQYFFELYIHNFHIKGDKKKFNKFRLNFINYMLDVRDYYNNFYRILKIFFLLLS